jgi:hypothetical protein
MGAQVGVATIKMQSWLDSCKLYEPDLPAEPVSVRSNGAAVKKENRCSPIAIPS